MISGRKVSRAAGALAVIVGVGACGSSKPTATTSPSSASPTSGSQSTSATSTQAAGAPIKVGIICSCSGPFGADLITAEEVYKAYVNTVNASGGINGHQIQVITEDDAATPGTSASDAQTLVADHVDAIVDQSIVDETWVSTVQAANIPVVGSNITETPFYTSPDFYASGQTNDTVTYANAVTAKASGATNLGSFYCAEAPSCAEGVPLLKAAGQKVGIPVVYNAEVAATAPNYTAQCLAAQQAHVSAIFIGDGSTVIARIGANCAQQGYKPIYVTEGEGFSLVMAAAAGIKDNLWSEYGDIPFFANTPAVQQMNAAVDKYYPGLRNNPQTWSNESLQAWPAGILLQDAVKAGGLAPSDTPSAAEIVKGLESLKGDTLQGMSPPLTFPAGQPHPIDCWFTARVTGGVPSLPSTRLTCQHGAPA